MAKKNEGSLATKKAPKTNAIDPDGGSSKGFMLAILGILVIGIGAFAFVATQRPRVDLDAPQTAAVEIDGDPLPAMPEGVRVSVDAATDPAIGQPFPTITGTSFGDNERVIENDGRAKAVYFLTHWCQFCQAEVQLLTEMIEAGGQPADLDIYGISTSVDGSRGNFPPVAWLDSEKFTPPVMRDSENSEAYVAAGAAGFPYVVYVGEDGNVLGRTTGSLDKAAIEDLWNQTVEGSMVP